MTPKLFIGSSSENLDAAYALQENLEKDAEVTVWTQGIFELTKSTLESLSEVVEDMDFAALIFSPDDVTHVRGREKPSVRDNVIFELGLFVGRIGRARTFIVAPSNADPMAFPSDLLGITPTNYEPSRQDKNLVAALGPTANRIRRAIKDQGPVVQENCISHSASAPATESDEQIVYDKNDFISIISAWMGGRHPVFNTGVLRFREIDRELRLPAGSAKEYIVEAAKAWDLEPLRQGNETIVFRPVDIPF